MGSRRLLSVLILLAGCGAPSTVDPEPAPAPPPAAPAVLRPQVPPRRPEPPANETHTSRRTVEIRIEPAKFAGKKGAELWTTPDAGKNWTDHGAVDLSRGSAVFAAPRDGRYGVLLVPLGPDGRREYTPGASSSPEHTYVVDTLPPVVEVKAPNGGEVLGAGRTTIVQWVADDANLAPAGVRVDLATAGGAAWVSVAKDVPNTGQYHWDIRLATSGRFRLRVTARDLAGNEGSDVSDGEIAIDGLPPELRLEGPFTARELPARLNWAGGDLGGSGLKRVSLYVTRDNGQTWQHHSDDEDLASPILLKELDGVYGLRLAGADRVGNVNRPPAPGDPPQAVLVLDRTPPEVSILSPRGGGYLGGAAMEVRWAARDNLELRPRPISLFFSDDAGKTWKEIARDLPNDGMASWTPPKAAGADYRVKVVAVDLAGNAREAAGERFGIDASVPVAVATGPERANSNTVQVTYEIKDRGAAPIARATLYYRPENTKDWMKFGDDPDAASPVAFSKADGRYEIFVTCATEAGLRSEFVQKPPDPATAGQVTLTIDTSPPVLSLESFKGGEVVASAAEAKILWKLVEANPDPAGLTIHHSRDGGATWTVVASQLDPAKGTYAWAVPRTAGVRHKLRLVAYDRFGNRATAESERAFSIDDDPPSVTIVEKPPASGRSARVGVRYRASDPTSGVERVEIYRKPLGEGKPYERAGHNPAAEGAFEAELPGEGQWGFVVVAYDGAGHASADPSRDPRPDFVYVVDAAPPVVEIKKAGAELLWAARDNVTPADRLPVRISLSTDAGATWQVVSARHPNSGRADLRAHLAPGRKARVKVVAIDEAGHEGMAESEDFDPGALPPATLLLRGVEEGKTYPAGGSIAATAVPSDRAVRDVWLELSSDGGKTWTPLGTATRLAIPAKPGSYQVRAVGQDAAGRKVESNVVGFESVAVPREVRPPVVEKPAVPVESKDFELLNFPRNEGEVYAGGKGRVIAFRPETITNWRVELSEESGKEGTWRQIPREQLRRVSGGLHWDRLPSLTGRTFRIRVSGTDAKGAPVSATSRADFAIDSTPPRATVTRHRQEPGGWVVLDYKLEPSISPVKSVVLYVRQGATGAWVLSQTSEPNGEFRFQLTEPGEYQLHLAPKSELSLGGMPPDPEAAGQVGVRSEGAAPAPGSKGPLRLLTRLPDAIKGGIPVDLRWAGPEAGGKASLHLVVNGKRELLAQDLPAAGHFAWTPRGPDRKNCQIVVQQGDEADGSARFEIDATAPVILDVEIGPPR